MPKATKVSNNHKHNNWTVEEFCEEFRFSRDTFYRHAKDKKIKTIVVGRRRLIPIAEVERITENGL